MRWFPAFFVRAAFSIIGGERFEKRGEHVARQRSATEPQLSISTSAFTEFRRFNLIYADKTALIAAWARTPGLYLLTRPRRFGKSLLVTTLETLFRKGLKDFRGLAIESQWQDTTYRTVRFDFLTVKQFQTFPEFQSNLHHQLVLVFEPLGFGNYSVAGNRRILHGIHGSEL